MVAEGAMLVCFAFVFRDQSFALIQYSLCKCVNMINHYKLLKTELER